MQTFVSCSEPFSIYIYSPTSLIRVFLGCATDVITRFTNGKAGLRAEAREERRGLWADPQPVPRWEWRKRI